MGKVKKIVPISIPLLLIVWYLFCLPHNLFKVPLSATAVTADGTLLGARISADGQWYFPPADHVPDKFARCIVTYEDKRFWWHLGIDYLSAGRALVQNLTRGEVVSGASTLTMQVIRLSRPGAPRTLPEKVYEMILATRLEMRCTKRKILLLYASNAPFGGNVVGIEAAAWRYFGRSADDLSWGESAMLAVLPNAPGLIHPGRSRDRLLEKRNALLDKLMQKDGFKLSDFLSTGRKGQKIFEPFALQAKWPELYQHFYQRLSAKYREVKRGELSTYHCDDLLSFFPEKPETAKRLFRHYDLLKDLRNSLAHTLSAATEEDIKAESGVEAAQLVEEIESVIVFCYPACDAEIFSIYDRCIDYIKDML